MLCMKYLYVILLHNVIKTSENKIQTNVNDLTKNFFANLKEDPLLINNDLNEATKQFIDKQVENYLNLVKKTYGITEHSVSRRSLPISELNSLTTDNAGVYFLEKFLPVINIQARFPKDLQLFKQTRGELEHWYAVALECDSTDKTGDNFAIYKHVGDNFVEIKRAAVVNGVKIGLHTTSEGTFIIIAENNPKSSNIMEKTLIFLFGPDEVLKRIQSVDACYANNVAIWEDEHDIYMIISQSMVSNGQKVSYEVETPVYKWLGQHFDVMHHIKMYNGRKVTPFIVGNSHYLAVANFQNDFGETNIYSEIFKHDLHTDQFVSYQKILTNAATDVKYFCFKSGDVQEVFLIIANSFEKDLDGNINYDTNSIVYKYVDLYFIPFQSFPLNGVTEWLPVVGPNGEFVLLAATKYNGIKSFQYNGWRFIESEIQYNNEAYSNGVTSMHSYNFYDIPVVVVANKNDNDDMMNVFQPVFKYGNVLGKLHENLLNWCSSTLHTLKSIDIKNLRKHVEVAPKFDDKKIVFKAGVKFEKVLIENLRTPGADDNAIEDDFEKLKIAESKLMNHKNELRKIQNTIETFQNLPGLNVLEGDVHIHNLTLNSDDNMFKSFTADLINRKNVGALRNVININEDFEIKNPLTFRNVTIEHPFIPKFINGHPISHFARKNDSNSFPNLTVLGNITFEKGFYLRGKLNGVSFNNRTVLLKIGDQNLTGSLNVSKANIEKLETKFADRSTTLKVDNLMLEGYLNGVNITNLAENVLRTSGNQEVTGTYHFQNFHANNVEVEGFLNDKNVPGGLISISGGNYKVSGAVEFSNDVAINKFKITKSLNQIPVIGGKLDLLLRNSSNAQHISGRKQFKNVESLNVINWRGNIDNEEFDQMNPLMLIEDEITVTGDYEITKDVTIEKELKFGDILTAGNYSWRKLEREGLKLAETEISQPLEFSQQITTEEIFAEKINNFNCKSFVVTGTNETQIISGLKVFSGNVHVTGEVNFANVNRINVQELENDVLKIEGNQVVTGKYHFDELRVNRITSRQARFGSHLWEELMTINTEQTINGSTIFMNNLTINNLTVKNLTAVQNVNDRDFGKMLQDTAFHGVSSHIKGNKTFMNLTVNYLTVQNGFDINHNFTVNSLVLNNSINISRNIQIDNIHFKNEFNGVPKGKFGKNWLYKEGNQTVNATQNLGNLTILGKAYIQSDFINGLNLTTLVNDAVKTDEPLNITSAIFTNGLRSLVPVTLSGQMDGIDLKDVVSGNESAVTMAVDKNFHKNVTIHGQLFFNDLVSGLNLSAYCNFMSPDYNMQRLAVNGSVYFAKGLEMNFINNFSIPTTLQTSWFIDRPATLTGLIEFNEVFFKDTISVQGLVDDVNVTSFSENYFSKTKNQIITGNLDFSDGVVFKKGVAAQRADIDGKIFDISLEDFLATALLNGVDQIYENTATIERCKIMDLNGDFTVNKFNLRTDFMRYDQQNTVTGLKTIETVEVDVLKINENVQVQGVNIAKWLQNAVLKYGTFKISGIVICKNSTSFQKGLNLEGLFNGFQFNEDNVMMRNLPQNITGKKIFNHKMHDPIKFKSIKLKQLINDIRINDLINNQVFQNQNSTFLSPVNFKKDLFTTHLQFDKLYQGINISQLIHNITTFAFLNNYSEHYGQLLRIAHHVEDSIKAQAYYLHYYKEVQVFEEFPNVMSINLNNTSHLAVADVERCNVNLYTWNQKTKTFLIAGRKHYTSSSQKCNLITAINYQNNDYLYLEFPNENYSNNSTTEFPFLGRIIDASSNNVIAEVSANNTRWLITVMLPDKNQTCFFAIYHSEIYGNLFCKDLMNSSQIYLHQQLITSGGFKAISLNISGTPYLVMNSYNAKKEARVVVWKYNQISRLFSIDQVINVAGLSDISTVTYRNSYYLAMALGHLQDTMYPGLVDIRRFDESAGQFTPYQNLKLNTPVQIEFCELPTEELILYVVTSNPTKPLIIYMYEGISGFAEKMVMSTLPKIKHINHFTSSNKHFVITQSQGESRVVEAIFKGTVLG